jgi:hypothetical protein
MWSHDLDQKGWGWNEFLLGKAEHVRYHFLRQRYPIYHHAHAVYKAITS